MQENYQDGTSKMFCDRCSKELTDDLILMHAGDVLCHECFGNEYKIMTVEEYLKGETNV